MGSMYLHKRVIMTGEDICKMSCSKASLRHPMGSMYLHKRVIMTGEDICKMLCDSPNTED